MIASQTGLVGVQTDQLQLQVDIIYMSFEVAEALKDLGAH